MKNSLIFLFTVFLFCHYGCSQEITDSNLPYEEKLVIRGVMADGDTVKSLYVGRTLPYEESRNSYWSSSEGKYVTNEITGYVKDAIVTISVDDETYQLQYIKDGNYRNDSLLVKTGKTYHLNVKWKDKTADAVTTVPESPILDSVNVTYKTIITYNDEHGSLIEYSCNGYARTKANNILSFEVKHKETYHNIFDTTKYYVNVNSAGITVQKRTQTNNNIADILIKKITLNNMFNDKVIDPQLVMILIAYDEPYYKYYLTSGGANGASSFSIEPRPVAWNVTGDAIGMFIGVSKSVTKIYKLK